MMESLPGDPGFPPGVTAQMIEASAGPDRPPDEDAYCEICGSPLPVEHSPDDGAVYFARCPRPGCRECC